MERVNQVSPSLDRLADYAGDYYCEELGVKYQLSIEDNHLTVSHKNSPPDRLKPIYENLFKGSDNSFEFIYNDLDIVKGFKLNAGRGRVRSIHFIKQ